MSDMAKLELLISFQKAKVESLREKVKTKNSGKLIEKLKEAELELEKWLLEQKKWIRSGFVE